MSEHEVDLLLCTTHKADCREPDTGLFGSKYPDEEPCLMCEITRLGEENRRLSQELQKCRDAHALRMKRKAIERNGTG